MPRVEYTDEELANWKHIYTELAAQIKLHACKEHLEAMEMLERDKIYSPNWIPQLEDVSNYIKSL